MTRSFKATVETLTSFALYIFAAIVLAVASEKVAAAQNQEEQSQREWVYSEHADVVTGQLYPAALLVSRSVAPAQAKGIGLGYLSVGNYSKLPMKVKVSWDTSTLWKPGSTNCKPSGCEMTIRFGGAAATRFVALQDKNSPTLVLQDGRALVAAATRNSGIIEVEVQTLNDGMLAFHFSTSTRLQLSKLGVPQ